MKNLEADFIRQIRSYIKPNMKLIAACSGGGDSICLLALLDRFAKHLHYSIIAAHLNHGLRQEANKEEEFVKSFCRERGIPLETRHVQIKKLSQEEKISEELCGRRERYAFFEELQKKYQADLIVTAHHRDDQAETMLMHLIRGCGLDGLCGIKPLSGSLFRPLLPYTKKELLTYLQEHDIPYMTDQSNFSPRYFRNRVRLQVIPLLEDMNPNLSETLSEAASLYSEDNHFLSEYAKEKFLAAYTSDGLLRKQLQSEPLAIRRRMLQLLYRQCTDAAQNLSVRHIDAMLALSQSGQKADLPGGYCCYCDYQTLTIQKKTPDQPFSYEISENQPCKIPELRKTALLRSALPDDMLRFTLTHTDGISIRSWQNGDFFFPVGMTGRKKISDFFQELKIPHRSRSKIPILVQNDQIIAVLGFRQDRRFLTINQNETKNKEYTLEIQSESC